MLYISGEKMVKSMLSAEILSHKIRKMSHTKNEKTSSKKKHQYKGVNLTEKLESESDILWTQRKKIAEEKGRIAETKLTFPLALLLLVLILITAAPAIMEM